MIPVLLALVGSAQANERLFTYTYETTTLPAAGKEIEPWVTFVPGEDGVVGLQQRMELEWGITDRHQAALYLNWSADLEGASYDGVSLEWKGNLLSRVVSPVGLALYAEAGLGPAATELEAKVLVDKEIGGLIIAYNLVGEVEFERELEIEPSGEVEIEHESEIEVNNLLAVAWRAPFNASFGLEFENVNEFVPGEGYHETKLALGPALGYSTPTWWVASTAMVWLGENTPDEGFEVEVSVTPRVLMGFSF